MKQTIEFRGKEFVVKYKHERPLDDCGNLVARGGKTVAFIVLNYDEITHKPCMTIEGEAVCSKHDVYCKSLGRKIALGRLEKEIEIIINHSTR